ncbi:mutator type transposase [Tanacetum coccineum]|uniref:Mutator type transposase n=1 Tax=Tanacetum coccineum TaxID=301880 RepID=A0ABQ5C5X7_9ASTR
MEKVCGDEANQNFDLLPWLDAKFAKDLTSTRIIPSTRKLNKLKRSDMENLDEQRLLTGIMEESLIKKLQENAKINTRNQSASLKNLETQIEQLTEKLCSRKEKFEQAKVVIVEHEGPSSPKKLKNLHEVSFLSDSQEENTNDQLPTKESNPGHFTLPYTIGNFNFYAMADLGARVNVLPRNIFEYLELTNLSETEMLVEMADMRKKASLGVVRDILVKIDKFLYGTCHVVDSVWSKRYSKWCNKNSHDKKPRPRDYTFKEWVKLKKGHLDISKSVRKDLFRLWVIDKSTEALDPDEDPFGRCLDEYNWAFPKEIEQLADEYEIKIRKKGKFLKKYGQNIKKLEARIKIGGMITGEKQLAGDGDNLKDFPPISKSLTQCSGGKRGFLS